MGIARYLLTGWVFPWCLLTNPFHCLTTGKRVFLSIFQPSPTQYLDCGWAPVFFNWVPPLPGTVKWEGSRTCYTPPNKTQDLQPTWEILEPEETQSNPSELPRRWMGTRGFCCYQCSTFPQSSGGGEGICSGSLHVGCQNCLLKNIVTTWQQCFIWWERYDFKPGRQRLW